MPLPSRPTTKSRRSLQAFGKKRLAVELCNEALAAISQLAAGRLDDRLLRPSLQGTPVVEMERPSAEEIRKRVLRACMAGLPPEERPIGDAAVQRLLGGGFECPSPVV